MVIKKWREVMMDGHEHFDIVAWVEPHPSFSSCLGSTYKKSNIIIVNDRLKEWVESLDEWLHRWIMARAHQAHREWPIRQTGFQHPPLREAQETERSCLATGFVLINYVKGGGTQRVSWHCWKWGTSLSSFVKISELLKHPAMCCTSMVLFWTCSLTAFSRIWMYRIPFVVMLCAHWTQVACTVQIALGLSGC